MDDLLEYKNELFNSANIDADANEIFPEESFFEYVSVMLAEAGILDNVEYCPYRNTRKGLRLDGYSWNALEKTICGIIVNFTNEPDVLDSLTNKNINDISRRVTRFFEHSQDLSFIESLEVTDPGHIAATDIAEYLKDAIKIRVVLLTDQLLSDAVKKISIDSILAKDTSIEIWDLKRLKELEQSDADYEEFTVDVKALGGGIKALPANTLANGVETYLGIMPGTLLSAIYDEYGQRLLESNVRTFLDFRASTNKGMRKTLLTEPENFFAYNNGLTITATSIETEIVNGQLTLTKLENMQIVNGGQTTAAIYFSPKDKGKLKGKDRDYLYSDIDLTKVFIQMKLTVVGEKEAADVIKGNIAIYANSQNSIQQSDLVSNHPFHLNIETRSRKQLMPAGESGLPSKWFYERARGQFSTKLRALSKRKQTKFIAEYPKKQMFTKTDMAKYENTWRMKPYLVKKGAQANLKFLGPIIIEEFDKNPDDFGGAFYNDLVAKMILFRDSDFSIPRSEWYKLEKGFKAEIVTYTLSLLRFNLIKVNKDINLSRIFQNQAVSESLLSFIVNLAEKVRNNLTNSNFRGGIANPSEFAKSEKGWLRYQKMEIDLAGIDRQDVLDKSQINEADKERQAVNETSKSISFLDSVMQITSKEWELISAFNIQTYPYTHMNVSVPNACVALILRGKMPSDKQLKLAVQIRDRAYEEGFDFA
ncbi:MAG: AIPR family protein [Colwellia sp.]|uniref:AIPR family protein n=1 Tax=Colwellia sp. TaxID=56799 RepID=UPI0025C3AC73|nr:AIPR family protein [Colwellia sp.]NQZ28181.1 AIPR family protein [Colwellia sp.]